MDMERRLQKVLTESNCGLVPGRQAGMRSSIVPRDKSAHLSSIAAYTGRESYFRPSGREKLSGSHVARQYLTLDRYVRTNLTFNPHASEVKPSACRSVLDLKLEESTMRAPALHSRIHRLLRDRDYKGRFEGPSFGPNFSRCNDLSFGMYRPTPNLIVRDFSEIYRTHRSAGKCLNTKSSDSSSFWKTKSTLKSARKQTPTTKSRSKSRLLSQESTACTKRLCPKKPIKKVKIKSAKPSPKKGRRRSIRA